MRIFYSFDSFAFLCFYLSVFIANKYSIVKEIFDKKNLIALFSSLGTIGNFLAIAAYFTNKRIQTPFNLLVVNLAMVDFIASTTITPITIYGNSYSWKPMLNKKSAVVYAKWAKI